MEKLRREFLSKQLFALGARARLLQAQAQELFGSSHPGATLRRWRKAFIIPNDKLSTVFQLAIKECRARAHLRLPPNGNHHSVIQVNTDLPTYIDRAVDLAALEGYPGHHVYNSLLEKNLTRSRGWLEFSVYPLYSPQSLIAEGTANLRREIVFTKPERLQFDKEVLWPAAGLDPARVEEYYTVQDYSTNEATRQLIDGKIDEPPAVAWLEKYAMQEPVVGQKRVQFIQHSGRYVINYNYGEDLVRHYLARRGGTADHPAKRWEEFGQLLSSPRLPSGLR